MVKRIFEDNASLFAWRDHLRSDKPVAVEPWKPEPVGRENWPPDYKAVYAWRIRTLDQLRQKPEMLAGALRYYAKRPGEFAMHWMDTYDPRKDGSKWIPFVFFIRQAEFLDFVQECERDKQSGLVEKCRDAGVTWLGCAYSVHQWLFVKSKAIGWGSRKQDLVDKLGNPDSIFEKMRLIVRRLPREFMPSGFSAKDHMTFMRFINPENGSVIMGEAGDNIGRGGRTSIYFKDEAQPFSAKILTPFGWQTMGDMTVGSLVCGPDGSWRQVVNINECGVHDVYRVGFSDGTSTEVSENHLWTVDKVIGKRERLNLSTSEISGNLFYRSPGGQKLFRYRVPKTEPTAFVGRGNYPLHPYIVGVLLGDGSVNSGCVTFTSADDEIASNVASRLPAGCKVTRQTSDYGYRIVDMDRYTKSSRARSAIVASGIAGTLSFEKSIPEMYKFGSVDDRLHLLHGLMDTDGSASGGTCTYHTSSPQLADDVRFLVQSLGGTASLNVKPDHRGYRDMYCLHVTLPNRFDFFKLKRKNEAVNSRRRAFGRTIVSVDHVGQQDVRCITVDAADGLYLTDHCIVTHNSAHYPRPELIEAALGDNTNVQIDISSVNGLGNAFHRRREAGVDWSPNQPPIEKGYTRVFIVDWRDHPGKTQEWYDTRRAKYEREGLLHLFAQEVDRDYSAAVANTIIPYEWITHAVDAHMRIRWRDTNGTIHTGIPDAMLGNNWIAGLDIADNDDGNGDRNALVKRQGIILRHAEEWGERDAGVTTRRAVAACRGHKGIKVQYDIIGMGSTVKAEYNRLIDEGVVSSSDIRFIPWNAGAAVVDPYEHIIPDDEDSELNKDFFGNMKAQAWWSIRSRFYKTFKNITEGVIYPIDDMISLDSTIPLLHLLMKQFAQPTRGDTGSLKTIVNKKPKGMRSPNLADAGIQAFFPVEDNKGHATSGIYGA